MGPFRAFGEMERAGWSDAARASAYVDLFASASNLAIEDLLNSIRAERGLRVLDLCCGQGNVTKALTDRGCEVVGADFSPAMLALAEHRVPSATFVEADAQDLPFEDAEFDAVVSNLGVCHVPDQPKALSEVCRALRRGGRFAMTVWCGPDTSPAFQTLYDAVKAHGHPDVTVPDGPDFHQFANREVAESLLSAAGFSQIEVGTIDCYWDLESPGDLSRIYEDGTVRAAALLGNQPPENLNAIRSDMESVVRERFSFDGRWRVPIPAALVKAVTR